MTCVAISTTQPRAVTPTSEVAVIDTSENASGHWWKLVTLAGQSNYYTRNQSTIVPANATLPCLSGAQPDPPQPGRTDPIVNGACVVCNATHPCLFDILNDPSEQVNVAADHPDRVQHLSALVDFYQVGYAFLVQTLSKPAAVVLMKNNLHPGHRCAGLLHWDRVADHRRAGGPVRQNPRSQSALEGLFGTVLPAKDQRFACPCRCDPRVRKTPPSATTTIGSWAGERNRPRCCRRPTTRGPATTTTTENLSRKLPVKTGTQAVRLSHSSTARSARSKIWKIGKSENPLALL